MSDSPLDGGSGWPTSAYAVVPRQPTAPEPETVPGPVAEDTKPAEEPARGAPSAGRPGRPARKGRVVALVVGLIVLVIAAAGGVLATRGSSTTRDGGTTNPSHAPAVVTTPTANGVSGVSVGPDRSGGSTGVPSLDPSGSAGPGGVVVGPIPEGGTDVLRVGTVRLTVLLGQPDEAFDFDTGTKSATGGDVTAAAVGLSAGAGAQLAVWTAPEIPSFAGCAALPAEQWVNQVVLAVLVPGSRVCVYTNEARYAWFTPRGADLVVAGQIYSTYLDFTVFKKPGD
ncbi:hypothetical protein Drose_28120 [Dactylosporangium roseum]|uniref:Uncharacterized protein n=1 Tax=Dactylosporangium roseum TaxID=47989 RepID=A0ABY5Z3G7_9ACTN|nr:hypothetical protein [Dactylosporangium roseum]UWZ35009.1 hypothetical protein Drose_28120 [Dactylosporangium roseum]